MHYSFFLECDAYTYIDCATTASSSSVRFKLLIEKYTWILMIRTKTIVQHDVATTFFQLQHFSEADIL